MTYTLILINLFLDERAAAGDHEIVGAVARAAGAVRIALGQHEQERKGLNGYGAERFKHFKQDQKKKSVICKMVSRLKVT